ncbi:MAG: DUF1553 domain-containing protein [Planctomycetota bacterium]
MNKINAISISASICFGVVVAPLLNCSVLGKDPLRKPVNSQTHELVDFENDLIPMFTKLGCNAGKCHGSAIGRGDFKLSLYGGTPVADYEEIVRKLGGRRVNLNHPESSLLYLKPTELVGHDGGTVFEQGDESARKLLSWIRQGAKYVSQRELLRIDVTPKIFHAAQVGDVTPLKVMADYDDGSSRDVTRLTQFVAEDGSALAINNELATAKVMRPGRHILMARYSTEVVPIELMSPLNVAEVDLSSELRSNFIDEQILRSLAELRLPVSPRLDDRSFIRRVTLDLTGRLPDSKSAPEDGVGNREVLVDSLLASEEFVEFYSLKLAKLFRVRSKVDKNSVSTTPKAARAFHDWLAQQLRDGVGYDKVAQEILTATGDSAENGPATFFTLVEDARQQTEFVTEVFMGCRMKCANCHNHPLDRWTQDDFHGLTAMFAKLTRSQIIQLNSLGKNIHPNTGEPARMKIPGGAFLPTDVQDGRQAFANWLVKSDNPFFAKAIVNRLWKSMMGRGLVEPVDDFRATNPATHPALLQQLANDFVQHDYDIRHTLKTIAMSSAYARSSNPVDANEADQKFYSHAMLKPLEPEVLADAIFDVLGVPGRFGNEEWDTRAVQLRDGSIPSDALDVLGRCDRSNSCEGAPSPTGPLAQKLHLLNGELLNRRLGSGRLHKLIKSNRKPFQIVNEFYQIALNREPNEQESKFLAELLDSSQSAERQREVLEDFVWSIVTCKEFTTNH